MIEKVVASEKAIQFIRLLKAKHGPLMFHQSGGCCDGSAPMCYRQGNFIIGNIDVLLGEIEGCPFYMNKLQYEYWKHTQLVIDVVSGRGSMFSLEGTEGQRFMTRSRVFHSNEEGQMER